MCGFSGILSEKDWSATAENLLNAMNHTLHHRGPDDQGIWFDNEQGIGLAHARLSILDLSAAGHQPMRSHSGRYVIAYNGEIYNHLELRKKLVDVNWRSHSDTDTLLEAFEKWGIEKTLKQVRGMFAFALWDRKNQQLTLARDRAGEKPLYYGWQKEYFLFGSELKALKLHPIFQKELNQEALSLYLRHNYVPAPHSIYKNIFKLIPGTFLQVSLKNPEPRVFTYWSATQTALNGARKPFADDAHVAVEELEQRIKNSVREQMIADVPLGAFLSGGLDSSTIVALMQTQSSIPIKTFSIGFYEKQFNEAEHAKAIAEHLSTDHTELYISTEDALAVIPKLSTFYDEPFSDSSQIPTCLVAELAKQKVSVAISGDAGDELFCGYNRYTMTAKLWNKIRRIPLPARRGIALSLRQISPHTIDKMVNILSSFRKYSHVGAKIHKGAEVLTCNSVNEVYRRLISHHDRPYSLLTAEISEPAVIVDRHLEELESLQDIQRMMTMDFMSYLPDDILVKVDRAAMGVSLETRVPFLDQRLVEFAWSLPQDILLREGLSKWPLRQILQRYVPNHLFERPKMGFAIPLHEWLCGPLRQWASALLDPQRLSKESIFDVQKINQMWQSHLEGKGHSAAMLWNILMFQAWWETQ